jgi:branched-chain amino acid transport system ATP-binding protein
MLTVQNLSVSYGAIQALEDISLHIKANSVTAIVGVNGAGKSTLLNTIVGLVSPSAGVITMDGEAITHLAPEKRAALGIAFSPEGRKLFPDMNVHDNLLIGAYRRKDKQGIRDDLVRMYTLFPSLKKRQHSLARNLSGGEQQMCAIGRALMARPRLLLLDEPSLGLAPVVIKDMAGAITEIAQQGVTIILVEQNSKMALSLSDWAYVFETGKLKMSGPSAELSQDDHVIKAYLG